MFTNLALLSSGLLGGFLIFLVGNLIDLVSKVLIRLLVLSES